MRARTPFLSASWILGRRTFSLVFLHDAWLPQVLGHAAGPVDDVALAALPHVKRHQRARLLGQPTAPEHLGEEGLGRLVVGLVHEADDLLELVAGLLVRHCGRVSM